MALQVILDHAAIDVASVGRLACTTRDMNIAVSGADIWRQLYEKATSAVAKYERPSNSTMLSTHGLTRITWYD